MFSESRYLSPVKFFVRTFFALAFLPLCAFASNSVVNLSHYDLMRVDFVAMKNEGVVGVIHEATFPRLQRDWRYFERQASASQAGLLWGAYHFGDGTSPISQADHFLAKWENREREKGSSEEFHRRKITTFRKHPTVRAALAFNVQRPISNSKKRK